MHPKTPKNPLQKCTVQPDIHTGNAKIADFTAVENQMKIWMIKSHVFHFPVCVSGSNGRPRRQKNCPKRIRKQQNFIQKPYRVHSSAVRTSWETILCAFESWDRAWQHTNTLRTRLRSIRLQIYGFAPWHDNNHTARSQTEPPTDLKNCTRGVGTILGKCPPSMPRIFFSSVVLETISKVLDTRFQGAKNENSQNAAGSTRVTG